MGYPKTLKENLSSYGLYMELDTAKQYCAQEPPHWHLCKNGKRIGQIFTNGLWKDHEPEDVNKSTLREIVDLTLRLADKITEYYYYNKENGSDY